VGQILPANRLEGNIPTSKQPFYKRKNKPHKTQIIVIISACASELVLSKCKGIGEFLIYISNIKAFFLSVQDILLMKECRSI